MNRREKLISQALSPAMDESEAKMLDTTMRLILADMGKMYAQFCEAEGLHSAQEAEERNNNEDLAESLRRILVAAQKIDPEEKAGYIINDKEGIRYLEIDYNKGVDK